MIHNLDKELTKLTAEYHDLHTKLDKHRGHPLEETDLEEVNKIIRKIQDKYAEIYPVAYWISQRYEYAVNISKSHEMFISQLIQNGATERQGDQ